MNINTSKVKQSNSQTFKQSNSLKDESQESHEIYESHESCESDREQAFPQEYTFKGNYVLVPNNSQDRTHIYDFSKDESVKTIN
jgi:6-phosphogluconolactonase (cycloisomerase 2 family)